MKEEERRKILQNIVELKCLNLYEAVDEFLANGLLTENDKQRIEWEKTQRDQNGRFLDIIVTKGDEPFPRLIKWLKKEGHSDIASRLSKDVLDTSDIDKESKLLS